MVQASVQVEQPLFQSYAILRPGHAIDTSRRILPQGEVGRAEQLRRDMVEKRRETLLRVSLYSLPYPVCRLWHAHPTLRPARALASRISLGWGPFLRRLRRCSRTLVRRPHRSYGPIRLLQTVLHRIRHSPSPTRPRHDRRGSLKTSQGPDRRRADVHGFSDTAGLADISPMRCLRCCLRPKRKPRRPELRNLRCSIALPTRSATDASPAPSR